MTVRPWVTLALAAALVGCGGGGGGGDGGDDAPGGRTTAEGIWTGRSSAGYDVALVVLDNGETWGVYAREDGIHGALHGTTSSGEGNLSGSGREFDIVSGSITRGSFTGRYTPRERMTVTLPNGSLSAEYSDDYDRPASLSALAGSYSGVGVATGTQGAAVTLQVSSTGAISAPLAPDCTAGGTVAPRPGGKNVFDLRITFTGAGCVMGNGTAVNGIAYYEDGTVLAMGLRPSSDDGFIFVGLK